MKIGYIFARLWWVVMAVLGTGCGGQDGGEPDNTGADAALPAQDVTYYQHIKPIIDAKCASCHYQGGIAPFPMSDYDSARIHSGAARLAIEQGTMPPWPPADGCTEYAEHRGLTAEQKAAFLAWVDRGAPAGDPSQPGAALPSHALELERVDATVSMTESYVPQVTADAPDEQRCFLVPWPGQETSYATGMQVVPGNAAVVHHVIVTVVLPEHVDTYLELDASEAGPGYSCFGDTRGPSSAWLGGWVPGSGATRLPPGVGVEIPAGSMLVMQMHYNGLSLDGGVSEPDLSTIELTVESRVDKVAQLVPFANPAWLAGDMLIPAGEPDVSHELTADPSFYLGITRMEIYAAVLHMHLLGSSAVTSIERADGTSDCMLRIDRWDFDWQGTYLFSEPKQFTRGDQIRLACHWDNSQANQPVINGQQGLPRDVSWGDGSTDEMCLAVFVVVPQE